MFKRFISVFLLLFLLLQPALGDQFGAISFSPSTGKWGYSHGFTSRNAAEADAVMRCHVPDARAVVWVKNGWAALAQAADGSWGTGWSTNSRAEAEEIALQEAGGGSILCWVFSGN